VELVRLPLKSQLQLRRLKARLLLLNPQEADATETEATETPIVRTKMLRQMVADKAEIARGPHP
jgi:hypothetical protein